MNQCLRCNKPCGPTLILCDSCRLVLQNQRLYQPEAVSPNITDIVTAKHADLTAQPEDMDANIGGDPLERITMTFPPRAMGPSAREKNSNFDTIKINSPLKSLVDYTTVKINSPLEPLIEKQESYNTVEQTLHKLNDAAQSMEITEQEPRRHPPRVSRLSPLRDISGEIHRQSTPMPSSMNIDTEEDLGKKLPDLWPWLEDDEDDEQVNNAWVNFTDPLVRRRFAGRSREIEQIDTHPMPTTGAISYAKGKRVKVRNARLRAMFFGLVVVAIIALLVDSVLLSVKFIESRFSSARVQGTPTLLLSTNTANYGQTLTIHVRHFTSSGRVYLSRDTEELLKTTTGNPVVQVSSEGNADVLVPIGNDWNPGSHMIEAEDITTRYTASTTLQITSGPTRPPHLLVNTARLDFGAGFQGANTIQPLTLHNEGSGKITWSASSDQSWLLTTPNRGIFSDSESIAIGVQRSNLRPGDYTGTITISSDVNGIAERIQVAMSVKPLPPHPGAVISVTPVVLSYTAIDGEPTADTQFLAVSNIGDAPLRWSIGNNTPNTLDDISRALINASPGTSWLRADPAMGVVQPSGTQFVRVSIRSQDLLPGVYINTLVFNTNGGAPALNVPEDMDASVTVQPRCSLTLNSGTLAFTAISGLGSPSNHTVTIAGGASCSDTVNWHATTSANWLTLTPSNGQIRGTASSVMSVGVNSSNLQPGTYTSNIVITTTNMSQTVVVQLTVQPPPPPTSPIMGVSPLNLNFSMTQGQQNPPGQVVTITNTGGGDLKWSVAPIALATSWLGASPSGGTIKPGETEQVLVRVDGTNFDDVNPNGYNGNVVISATDANNVPVVGSPQTVGVHFAVQVPCTLSQSSNPPTFNAVQGSPDPQAQPITVTALGNCNGPLSWKAVTGGSSWLHLSATSGSLGTGGQSSTFMVAPSIAGLAPGTYNDQVTITATDATGAPVPGTSQSTPVVLTIMGFAVSGQVVACDNAGNGCAALPGALVTLNGGNGFSEKFTADGAGNFVFTNIPLGTYTISVSGTDGANVHHAGSATVTISSNQTGIVVKALAGA